MGPADTEIIRLFNKVSDALHAQLYAHVVSIAYVHTRRSPLRSGDSVAEWEPTLELCSGFLIKHNGNCLLCTAGHVLRDLKLRGSGDRKIVKVHLLGDIPSGDAKWIDIREQIVTSAFEYDETNGIDMGFMELSRAAEYQLEAIRTTPFPSKALEPPSYQPNVYLVLGFPRETRKLSNSRTTDAVKMAFVQRYPMLPIEPVGDAGKWKGKIPRFTAKRMPLLARDENGTVPLVEINGMSGGPIVAVELLQCGWRYSLLAIQTHENEEDGTLGGCYLKNMLDCLEGLRPWK